MIAKTINNAKDVSVRYGSSLNVGINDVMASNEKRKYPSMK